MQWLILLLLLQFATATCVRAGMGPENLLVVVNANSLESRTVANHYVQLRQIPTSNVVLLKNVPTELVTSLENFRERILKPILAEIDGRGLSNQIRAVAYSSHFPYAVDVQPHYTRLDNPEMRKVFTPTASINGLTYLYRFVLADREEYLSPAPNLYARMTWARNFTNPFSGEDDKEEFALATEALKENEFATASEKLLGLFKKHPHQAPLGILAARSFAGSGKTDQAVEQLNAAVKAGWTSGKSLAEDQALLPLADRTDFKELIEELDDKPTITQRLLAFETSRAWTSNGWWTRSDLGGMTYLPSCMLAVNRGSGTSVEQAVDYLTKAVQADNSFPQGTFYFTATADVRTKTRTAGTIEALAYLRNIGQKAELIATKLPENRSDVLGITFGAATYDWPGSNSQFLPGAIGDNLTSTSGMMRGTNQTVLTELLKNGAAIASGTVVEPYALQFKFPLPLIHAFYAEGLTAIESYYLSLASPYQLLIVGDPLCQPHARQPSEVIGGRLSKVNGVDSLMLQTKSPDSDGANKADDSKSSPISSVEFYIDGKLAHRTEPKASYNMKLAGLGAGSHEFRTVLVGEQQTAPRKSILTWINIDKLFPIPEVAILQNQTQDGSRTARVKVSAVGSDAVKIMHFGEQVGQSVGEEGIVELDLTPLGNGPIRLRGVATFRGTEVAGREFIVQ